ERERERERERQRQLVAAGGERACATTAGEEAALLAGRLRRRPGHRRRGRPRLRAQPAARSVGELGRGRGQLRTLLAALVLLAGCEPGRPCRTQTLLLTVTLDATSAGADRVEVDVSIDGTLSKTNFFDHVPGDPSGSVEIDFTSGYPAGHPVGINV